MKSSAIKLLTLAILMCIILIGNVFAGTPIKPLSEDTEFEVFVEGGDVYAKITENFTYSGEGVEMWEGPVREGNTFSVKMLVAIYEILGDTTEKEEVVIKLGNLENGNYKFVIKYFDEISHEFEFVIPVEKVKENTEIKVSIDNKFMEFENPPVIVNDRVLIPLRSIFEEMGCTVDWEPSERKVYIKKGDIDIVLAIGSSEAIRNTELIKLDVPAEIINDRTYVPIRFVCESIGNRVDWNSFNREVQIYNNKVLGTLVKAVENFERDSNNCLELYEDKLYFVGDQNLYKMKTDFTDVNLVNKDRYLSFNIHNGFIYSRSTLNGTQYSNGIPYSILLNRENLDGSGKVKLLDLDNVQSYEIYEDWINYFLQSHFNKRISLDGQLDSDFKTAYPIKLDENWYTNGYTKENVATGKVENIYEGHIVNLSVDGEWIYFNSKREMDNSGHLYRIKTDGSYLTQISDSNACDVIVKDGWIYYIDYIVNEVRLFKVKEDGTQRTKLYAGIKGLGGGPIRNFAGILDDWIFYRSDSNIYKTKIDGSETKVFTIQ